MTRKKTSVVTREKRTLELLTEEIQELKGRAARDLYSIGLNDLDAFIKALRKHLG